MFPGSEQTLGVPSSAPTSSSNSTPRIQNESQCTPLHLQIGNSNIDPGALDNAALPDSVIWQRLSAWEEHRVHIDLFSVGAESFEMEICEGN